MRRRKLLIAAVAVAGLLAAAGAGSGGQTQGNPIYLAEISPLTGPLSFVGTDNRQASRSP